LHAVVTDPGYRFVGEQTKTCLQQACGAKLLRPISKNLRATFCASSGDSRHDVGFGSGGLDNIMQEILAQLTLAKQ
jgi:hypothetical protein